MCEGREACRGARHDLETGKCVWSSDSSWGMAGDALSPLMKEVLRVLEGIISGGNPALFPEAQALGPFLNYCFSHRLE